MPDEQNPTVPPKACECNALGGTEASGEVETHASPPLIWPQALRDVTNLLAVISPIAVAVITKF
ncbi:hypothetical protein [Streptomyces spiralis]|uniref:hypothetical protein n=1 Tax=Streptomyces spiralis TaxID=66376 RepID=UPI0036B25C8A